MYVFIVVLILLVCVLEVLAVVVQNSKGGGLSGSFQALNQATQMIGARRAADVVEKATMWLMGTLVVLTILANILIVGGGSSSSSSGESQGLRLEGSFQNAPTTAPSAQDIQPSETETPTEGE
jgi:preprotein translocase subunit SecG